MTFRLNIALIVGVAALAGCGTQPSISPIYSGGSGQDYDASLGTDSALTAEEFDTSTDAEREAAAQTDSKLGVELGTTSATLGNAAAPGFWLETPLVASRVKGHVKDPKTGKSLKVDLIPIEGPATAGSRLSLPAMRLLDVDLQSIVNLTVYQS
ncbi:MAG: D-galactarate dehydratase [Marinosulfonomonas sp.]